MIDEPAQTSLIELARSVPVDLCCQWEIQWFEDGTPCGHSTAPVGRYLHEQAAEIERLKAILAITLNEYIGQYCYYEAKLDEAINDEDALRLWEAFIKEDNYDLFLMIPPERKGCESPEQTDGI